MFFYYYIPRPQLHLYLLDLQPLGYAITLIHFFLFSQGMQLQKLIFGTLFSEFRFSKSHIGFTWTTHNVTWNF